MKTHIEHDIKSASLASEGALRIAWAEREMPVLSIIRRRFSQERPLAGLRVAACLHVTTETANLILTLRDGGAQVVLCASNPLSTQDDVAAALVHEEGISVFAIREIDTEGYYQHIRSTLDSEPQITLDDGADLVATVHRERRHLIPKIIGGTEETTTGVIRLRSMAREGALGYPIIAVNEALTKHLFDNRYGTGQSTIDGITRATNILWAGKKIVVCGYGWCGRGIAQRARGLGAQVIVTEIDPIKALEAAMEGLQVMPLKSAATLGDVFITVTGDVNVIDEEHMAAMHDSAILANSGHFNVELNLRALETMAAGRRRVRAGVDEYQLTNGRRLYVLAEGRLVNLAAAEGHPASVMDMSFANQALSVEYLAKQKEQLPLDVHTVPEDIDRNVATLKLAAMGITIDTITKEQEKYLASWESGTD